MYHEPVLLKEVLGLLAPSPGGLYLDCTLGGGGHSRSLLAELDETGRVIGLDRDEDALQHVLQQEWSGDARFQALRTPFSELDAVLPPELHFDGVLMDLGVSSHQIDRAARGFSFMQPGPLDMRMDRRATLDASTFLTTTDEAELGRVLRDFGELRNWRRVAALLVRMRRQEPLLRTEQLVAGLEAELGSHNSYKWLSQVFQAIRIAVNGELDELDAGLRQAFDRLRPGGRLAVISYHSLEDRHCKNRFREWCGRVPDYRPRHLPVREQVSVALPVTRKAVRSGEAELARNPRSRSARLRVIEKRQEA